MDPIGEVLILADDDRIPREAMRPKFIVRSVAEPEIEDVGALVSSAREPGG